MSYRKAYRTAYEWSRKQGRTKTQARLFAWWCALAGIHYGDKKGDGA